MYIYEQIPSCLSDSILLYYSCSKISVRQLTTYNSGWLQFKITENTWREVILLIINSERRTQKSNLMFAFDVHWDYFVS